MALTDKDIVITPNKGATATTPSTINFVGADANNSASITLQVFNNGTTGILGFLGNTTGNPAFAITDTATQKVAIGSTATTGAYTATITGNLGATTGVYSNAFFDTANTAYYIQPSSLSRVNGISALGSETSTHDPYGLIGVTRGTGANYSYYGLTRQSTVGMGIGIDTSNNLWFGGTSGGINATRNSIYFYTDLSGNVYANTSFRAPTFYSSSNSAYYLNLNAATGTILSTAASTDTLGYNPTYGIYIGGTPSGVYLYNGGTSNFPNSPVWVKLGTAYAVVTSGNVGNYALPYTGGTLTGQLDISFNNSTAIGAYANVSSAHLRLDNPTGTQNNIVFTYNGALLENIRGDASGNLIFDANSGNYYFNNDFGSTSLTFINKSTNFFTVNSSGNVTMPQNFYGPRFYDSNNNGYYVTPSATSVMNQVNAGTQFMATGGAGSGATFYAQGYATSGSAQQISLNSSGTYYGSIGNTYQQTWYLGWAGGTAFGNYTNYALVWNTSGNVGINNHIYVGGYMYDNANTSYYIKAGSTSYINNVYVGDGNTKMWLGPSGGTNYIESGNSNFTANAPLLVTGYNNTVGSTLTFNFANVISNYWMSVGTSYSGYAGILLNYPQGTSSSTIPAFINGWVSNQGSGSPHYVGNWYSSNWWGIGPNTSSNDNVVRIGQATNSGSPAQWSWTGTYSNLKIATLYASQFTDSNNTGYYVVPSGTSVMNVAQSNAIQSTSGKMWSVSTAAYAGGSTPSTGYLITTNIPFTNFQMPNIIIEGYAYGNGQPIHIEVVYYTYPQNLSSGSFVNAQALYYGWNPGAVYLAIDSSNNVVIWLQNNIYYGRMTVRFVGDNLNGYTTMSISEAACPSNKKQQINLYEMVNSSGGNGFSGNVYFYSNIYVQGYYYDNANTGYYIKPSGTSNVNALSVQSISAPGSSGITSSGEVYAGTGSLGISGSVSASNWFRSTGQTGWYNQTYGGGWYMLDTGYIRTYNSKNIYAYGSSVLADGSMYASGYYYDWANTGYYVKASGTSYLNSIAAIQYNWNSSGPVGYSHLHPSFETAAVATGSFVLGDGPMADLLAFNPPSSAEQQTGGNGTAASGSWSSTSVVGDMFAGRNAMRFGGNYGLSSGGVTGYRFTWSGFGYRWIDYLTMAGSTSGGTLYVTIEFSTNGSSWVTYCRDVNVGGTWPGYHYLRLQTDNSSNNPWMRITVVATFNGSYGMSLGNMSLYGEYGGYTPLFTWDYNRNPTFPNSIYVQNYMYDNANTGYYVKASGLSQLNSIQYGTSIGTTQYNVAHILGNWPGAAYWGLGSYGTHTLRFDQVGGVTSTQSFAGAGDVYLTLGPYYVATYNRNGNTGALYASTFYDTNNTGYYLTPSGTSVLNYLYTNYHGFGTQSNSGGGSWYLGNQAWGGSNPANAGVTSVSGIIYSGGSGSQLFTLSSGPGQASFQLDGSIFIGDGIGYNPIGANGSSDGYLVVQNSASYGGNQYTQGSTFVSGYYYDYANTGYYIKPSGTSYIYNLYSYNVIQANSAIAIPTSYKNVPGVTPGTSNSWLRGSSSLIQAGASNSDGSGWSYGHRLVSVDYGDGLAGSIDVNYASGWTNDVMTWSGRSGRIGYVGINNTSPSYRLHVSGDTYTSGSLYANIFYDNGNTGYYVQPRSTSNMYAINVYNSATGGQYPVLTQGPYDNYGNDYTYTHAHIQDSGDFGASNLLQRSAVATIYATSSTPFGTAWYNYCNIRHRGGAGDGPSWGGQIVTGMTGYQNRMAFRGHVGGSWTGWYENVVFNQNSSGNQNIYFYGHYDSSNTGYYLIPSSTSNLAGLSVANTISGNISGYSRYLTPWGVNFGQNGTGLNTGNRNTTGYYGAVTYTTYGDTNEYPSYFCAVMNFGAAQSGSAEIAVNWVAGGTASGIWFRNLRDCCTNWTAWARILNTNDDPYPSNMNQYVRTSDNPTFNSLYTQLFYDTNNTGYYSDPNGTSQLSYVRADNWFRPQSTTGLYFESYGYGLVTVNGYGSYGNVSTYGSGLNNWSGYNISQGNTTFMGNGGTWGVYNANGGWAIYGQPSNATIGINGGNNSSYALYVNGTIYATSNIYAYSDVRTKDNIVTVDKALDKVVKLRGVYYNRTDKPEGKETGYTNTLNSRELGVIAQEVMDVVPEIVSYSENTDRYGVNYGNLAGLFIEAIKDLKKEIEDLKAELNMIKGKQQ
jgi:Chaperone of endosialidase